MIDICHRLERSPGSYVCIRREAAAEIRALRKENAAMKAVVDAAVLYCTTGQDRGGEKLLNAVYAFEKQRSAR